MGAKLKREISGFMEIPHEYVCVDAESGEYCNCIMTDKLYIKEVLYNDPVTVVFWSDDTKTVSKAHGGDVFSKETGLAICTLKKLFGGTFVHDVFEDWANPDTNRVTIGDVRKSLKVDKHPVVADFPAEIVEEVKEKTPKKTTKKSSAKKVEKKPVKKTAKKK